MLLGASAAIFAQQGGVWPNPEPRPQPRQSYAVIAYNDFTGAYGTSWDFPNLNQATNGAVNACGGANCRPMVWSTACAALARTWDRRYVASAWDFNRQSAQWGAINNCQATTGQQCQILVSVCNSRIQ